MNATHLPRPLLSFQSSVFLPLILLPVILLHIITLLLLQPSDQKHLAYILYYADRRYKNPLLLMPRITVYTQVTIVIGDEKFVKQISYSSADIGKVRALMALWKGEQYLDSWEPEVKARMLELLFH
jgi:hypothetical protein